MRVPGAQEHRSATLSDGCEPVGERVQRRQRPVRVDHVLAAVRRGSAETPHLSAISASSSRGPQSRSGSIPISTRGSRAANNR